MFLCRLLLLIVLLLLVLVLAAVVVLLLLLLVLAGRCAGRLGREQIGGLVGEERSGPDDELVAARVAERRKRLSRGRIRWLLLLEVRGTARHDRRMIVMIVGLGQHSGPNIGHFEHLG